MTPEELRESIPALDDVTFFNTGASGPSPRPVTEAATEFLRRHKERAPAAEGMYPAAADAREENREVIADHLGADPSEIALTESTSDGVSALAAAIDWQPGDAIVRTDLEHPAGILPWQRAARVRGAEVRVVETDRGRIDLDAFAEAVEGARLACFSSLSWNYGTRLPVRELTEIARDAGARVLVDAVQSAGQRRVDLDAWGADYVAGSGHKWLLGPWGSGYLYVRDGATDGLHPAQVSYGGVEDPDAAEYALKPNAAMFERGTASPAPHVGMRAAVELLESVGFEAIERRIERLTDRLKVGLPDGRRLSPREYESGLVAADARDPEAVVDDLADRGIRIRAIPDPEAIRVSVHAFNTAEEIDRLLDALEACGAFEGEAG